MFITKEEVENHLFRCRTIVGVRLGIDAEQMPESVFLELLNQQFKMAGQLLARFLNAYRDWYAFHEQIEREGKAGRLSQDERAELHQRITERDQSRTSLLQYLDFVAGPRPSASASADQLSSISQSFVDKVRGESSDEAQDFLIRAGIIQLDPRNG